MSYQILAKKTRNWYFQKCQTTPLMLPFPARLSVSVMKPFTFTISPSSLYFSPCFSVLLFLSPLVISFFLPHLLCFMATIKEASTLKHDRHSHNYNRVKKYLSFAHSVTLVQLLYFIIFSWARRTLLPHHPEQLGSYNPLVHPRTTKWV